MINPAWKERWTCMTNPKGFVVLVHDEQDKAKGVLVPREILNVSLDTGSTDKLTVDALTLVTFVERNRLPDDPPIYEIMLNILPGVWSRSLEEVLLKVAANRLLEAGSTTTRYEEKL